MDISSLKLQEEEVRAVKWATLPEIKTMIEDGTFVPYHISFIEMLFFLLEEDGVKIKKEK